MTEQTTYDTVLYPSYVHAQTHPNRLASIATLFGLNPAPVRSSRILELACGQGGNLIPMAVGLPESDCVGIDLSERQIEKGQSVVKELGLTNIDLRAQSILDFPEDAGSFDYIIAHGVYSWVPVQVRDKILEICSRHLSKSGIGLVSYNTYPGWHQRRMIRDMMRFHTRDLESPGKRIEQAKAFLSFMTKAVPEGSAYSTSLKEESRSLVNADESYLFHEQLEEINDPLYFHEFADELEKHQLQYVSEVELSNLQFDRYPPIVAETMQKMDVLHREQYLDFMMRRTFRQTILCHSDVTIDRADMHDRIESLRIATPAARPDANIDFRSGVPVEFGGLGGVTATARDGITKSALVQLGKAWPADMSFQELETQSRKFLAGDSLVVQDQSQFDGERTNLKRHLFQSFVVGALELRMDSPAFVTRVSDRPEACPLARWQASTDSSVTSRMHRNVPVDPLTRHLIKSLDGKTDFDALVAKMAEFVNESDIVLQHEGSPISAGELPRILAQKLRPNLVALARWGILVR